eukprot:TRINITY_DN11485_c0_g1_i1.p1 TRINITY_DN11485_c0_g1~~TRINITY_DN11485_c0_g1_i1.p1  ORF type:complete len:868 (-),score=134.61 TRINITY_DN11485_c0_g1_i1:23-2605(-)
MHEATGDSCSDRLLEASRPSLAAEEPDPYGTWPLQGLRLQGCELRACSLPKPSQQKADDNIKAAVEELRTFERLHAPPAAKTTDLLLVPSVDVDAGFDRSASGPPRIDDFWRSQAWLDAVKARDKKDLLEDGQSDELFVSASVAKDFSGASAYRPCSVRLAREGVEFRPAALPADGPAAGDSELRSSPASQQQWFVPWEAVVDMRSRQPLPDQTGGETPGERPPESHPYVLEISVQFCLGLSSGSSCVLKIAGPNPFDDFLGSICKQKWLSEIVLGRVRDDDLGLGREASMGATAAFLDCPPLSERELTRPSIPSSASVSSHLPYAASAPTCESSTTTGTATSDNFASRSRFDGPSTPLHYAIPPDRRQQHAGDPKSAPSLPGTPAEGRFAHLFHSNTPATSRTIDLSEVKQVLSQSFLTAYQAEEPKLPTPISIEDCWMHVPPSCPVFHRCSVCVDKLGFSILPLGPKTPNDEPSTMEDLHASGLSFLATESLNFPLTAIIDAQEETTLEHIGKPADQTIQVAVPQVCHPTQPAQQTQQAQAHQQHQPEQKPSKGRGPNLHRRLYTPLARAVFVLGSTMQRHVMGPCQQAAEEEPPARPVPACSADRPPREAAHFVSVTVQGSLAGRQPGQDRTPPHLRMQADARPPIKITLAFTEKDQALRLISCLLDFKRYQISVALKCFVQTFATMANRERQHAASIRGASSPAPVASGKAATAPQPLPAVRPIGLPPASRLPRVVANEEGEVFWYMPRRQAMPPPGAPLSSAEQPGTSPPALSAVRSCTLRQPPAAAPSPSTSPMAAVAASCQQKVASRLEADECLCQVADEAPPYMSPVPSPGRPDSTAASVGNESHRLFTVSV